MWCSTFFIINFLVMFFLTDLKAALLCVIQSQCFIFETQSTKHLLFCLVYYILYTMTREHDEFRKEIGKRLSAVREKYNILQGTMAKQLGISRVNLYRLEKGEAPPNAYILYNLSTKFNISMEWLISGEGKMIRSEKPGYRDKLDFGEFQRIGEELFEIMYKVPFVKYAVLGFFSEYCKKYEGPVKRTLKEYEQTQEKLKSIQELGTIGHDVAPVPENE